MARQTIDFGIDLGTTNSAVAVLTGTQAEVVRNNENQTTTPSAVWVDESGAIVVGRTARERHYQKQEDAAIEFKRLMGDDAPVQFASSGRTMTPEELSAEVLKSLKGDVLSRMGEDLRAAVITHPAEFGLPQCAATDRAATLAGITQCPLLQEPIAAAMTYGFQAADENAFWLVYDMGGGTFDAAIIQLEDGMIEVVNHGGDHYLGGKVLDWAIVEELLIPAVEAEYDVEDFRRDGDRWTAPMAKLKSAAEDAKIQTSRQDVARIDIDYLGIDESREPMMDFTYSLSRSDVERLMEPLIVRSINIVRRVLEDKNLGSGDIEKLLLVGGPTLMPCLRERLADPDEGLGVELEFSEDPMTVVARGAAIFAGTQRIVDTGPPPPPDSGVHMIELEYDPMGPDPDPLIGGRVTPPEDVDLAAYTVELVNESLTLDDWSSGQIPLSAEGTFTATLFAESGHANEFRIDLRDATGTLQECSPKSITYTIGGVSNKPILTHSVGVRLANNEADVFFEKGTLLPARKHESYRTVVPIRRNQPGDLVRIPIIQGENTRRADRNRELGTLEIDAEGVARDVPAGNPVELTIDINESQLVVATAYVPMLDEYFERRIDLTPPKPDLGKLREKAREEKERLSELRERARIADAPSARTALDRIDREDLVSAADGALHAAVSDADALRQADDLLRRLCSALDEVEDALEWPSLVDEAEEAIKQAQDLVSDPEFTEFGGQEDVTAEVADVREAIAREDMELLRARLEELQAKIAVIAMKHPGFWLSLFDDLKQNVGEMTDSGRARQLINEGQRAIDANNLPGLEAACRELWGLMPDPGVLPVDPGSGIERLS